MRPLRSFCIPIRSKIMFGALLVALAASSIATIIIAEAYMNVTLLTSPDGHAFRTQEGKPFNVSCEGAGGQNGKFSSLKWTKNVEEEIQDGDPSTAKIGNKLFLLFVNPKTSDGGLYSCLAVYDNGIELQRKIFLEIYGTKPEFRISYENTTLEAGKQQYLMCEAEGEKPIEYKWYNQDEDRITVDTAEPVHVSYHDSHSRLNFKSLAREHEGWYTCTASNAHGLTSKVFYLKVTPADDDKGKSGFRDAKVLTCTTSNVTFYITTSGSVKYIEAKYKELGRQAPNETTTIRFDPAPENIYTIANLIPSRLYSFQFRTIPWESNDWSKEYNVTLLPETPEIIWRSIGDGTVKLQWFTKIDDILRGTIDRYQIKYFTVQQKGGNSWTSWNCSVIIDVPTCGGSTYTIAGLGRNVFYQIEVRAHTEAGYGEPASQKIFM